MIREHVMYSIVCDYPCCGADACEGSDYVAWATPEQATLSAVEEGDWRRVGDLTLCGDHWHWCENDDDEPKAGPAKGCCMFEAVLLVVEQ